MAVETTEYDRQADEFLDRNGLTLSVRRHPHQVPPSWHEDKDKPKPIAQAWNPVTSYYVPVRSGSRWLVRVEHDGRRAIEFDFWSSVHERIQEIEHPHAGTVKPSAYDILACISGDSYMTDADEVFAEYEEMLPSRCEEIAAHGRKLALFFTTTEQEELGEIQ